MRGDHVEGTPFGRYRLLDLLGRGGMGEVWRAFDTVTDRVVALKALPKQFADDEGFQERFRREARAAAGLDEPHVVPIHDYGEIDGRLFVTMRLIKGEDLHAIIKRGPLAPSRTVAIVEQIASALNAAHRIDLVHRDVKPSNILLAEDDFAYLIDFGIARSGEDARLTLTQGMIGTPSYMAPERFTTGRVDASSDVYGLTCVLHEAITGQLPFPGTSLEQLMYAHVHTPPPRPSTLRPDVPAGMDTVIATGLAKNPEHRYPTTKELAAAARSALHTPHPRLAQPPHGTPSPHATPPPRVADPAAATQYQPPGNPVYPPPRGALPQKAYTPWFKRVMACVIDYVPYIIIVGIGYGIEAATKETVCVTDTSGYDLGDFCATGNSKLGVAALLSSFLIVLAYLVWNFGYRQGRTGSSIGKSILKLKVVSERTGQPVGFGLSIVRQVAHIIDYLICYVGFLFPLWDAKRQTLADKIMMTVCVPL